MIPPSTCSALFRMNYFYNMKDYEGFKLDEDQDSYITTIFQETLAFSSPITCQTPENTAVIFDALAYEGQKLVVPEYLGNTVEQKGLRNEESIEMLKLITAGAYNDIGSMYGLTTDFITDYNNDIQNRQGTMASIIAKYKVSIEAAIESLESK